MRLPPLPFVARASALLGILLILSYAAALPGPRLQAQTPENPPPVPADTPLSVSPPTDLAKAVSDLQALPGKTSLLVLQNDSPLVAVNADTPLAVGSSFKMAVLLAVRKQIDSGQRSWSDIVPLNPVHKLPGDTIGAWPDGSLLTLQTYAGFMISKSDNTSTDMLIDVAGRRNVEQYTGRNRPLLTTHDLFFFRDVNNRSMLDQYRNADETQRRAMLDSIDSRPFDLSNAVGIDAPYGLDVEWYFSNRELCDIIAQVADLPLMGITTLYDTDTTLNHAPARPDDWVLAAYKGGSEAGVISVTTQVTNAAGTTYCLSATWNDEHATVDNGAFASITAGMLHSLSAR